MKSGNFGCKEILERVWSSVEFQLFVGAQSSLADHPPLRGKRSTVTYSIKDSAGNILTDENETFSRRKEYFKDLLNPGKTSHQLITHKK